MLADIAGINQQARSWRETKWRNGPTRDENDSTVLIPVFLPESEDDQLILDPAVI